MDKVTHSPGLIVLLFAVSSLLVTLVWWLFTLYQDRPARGAKWVRALEISPGELGGFGYWRLALISLLSLFLEMLMIRWISSEVRIFAYFKNLVLVACFLGFGLGCYLCRRRVQLIALIAPILVLTVILKTPVSPLRQIVAALPQMLGGGTEVRIWGVPSLPTSWPGMLLALAVMVPLFAAIAMTFVPCLLHSPLLCVPTPGSVDAGCGSALRACVLAKATSPVDSRDLLPSLCAPAQSSRPSPDQNVLVSIPEARSASELRKRPDFKLHAEYQRLLVPANRRSFARVCPVSPGGIR